MNREPPHKSMGFFGMLKETCKITFSWKKLFLQIFLATILPLTILNLSNIQISDYIQSHTYRNNKQARLIARIITEFVFAILILFFYLLSTSSVVYAVSCFYTSRDTNLKKVIGVFPKAWGRLLVTFLLFFFILAICTIVYLGLILLFVASFNGQKVLAFIICFSIPYLILLVYIIIVWNLAMVISVLEADYGRKALAKSIRLTKGKIWVSAAMFITLEILLTGIILALTFLVVDGKIRNLVGKIFVGIVCYLLTAFLLHISLVIQAIIYFVCKAYHNENISNVGAHLDNSYVNLVRGNEDQV